jgi:acyl-CoA thioesterase-2
MATLRAGHERIGRPPRRAVFRLPPMAISEPQDSEGRERDRRLVTRMMDLLRLEAVGPDLYRAPALPTEPRRTFGGHLVGQALSAASQTVETSRQAHSLHAQFVRAGVTNLPTDFAVARDADGSTFSFRRVLVTQGDKVLLSLSASFQAPAEGQSHQVAAPSAPPPEALEDDHVQAARLEGITPEALSLAGRASPVRFRSPDAAERFGTQPAPARQRFWFRIAAPVPGDQAFQRVVLAYVSDMMLLGVGLLPHGLRWFSREARILSLDHALWIHRDVTWDDWLFYDQESPWSGDGRNLNRGHIFDRAGRLVASVTQEGMMRPARPGA